MATREILWNVGSLPNVIVMYLLFGVALFVGAIGLFRQAELVRSGVPAPERTGRWGSRFVDLMVWAIFQRGVVRKASPGVAHTLIYIGFLVLLFTTTMVFVDHDLGYFFRLLGLPDLNIYEGDFYLALTALSDVLGFGLLIGVGLMAHRRYAKQAEGLHSRPGDSFLLISLALLIVQGFILEGLRIHVTNDPWAWYSPIGLAVGRFFWFLSADASQTLHFLVWWFHTVTVFSVMAVMPYTKFFHILASSVNLFFRSSGRPKGTLRSPGDLETLIESGEDFSIGLGTIKDYSWKQLLDLEACTSCGRCQDACPAYRSGKPLSPKWVILDTRNHALALHSKGKLTESILPESLQRMDSQLSELLFLRGNGLLPHEDGSGYNPQGSYRAKNELVQSAALKVGANVEDRIAGEVIDPEVFWSCTTCRACVEACPVGIDHVDQIIGNRRNMVLMEGEIPSEAQGTLRALENRSNPYGPQEDRAKWLEDLGVPIVEPGGSVDYLYWVGCVSSFDPRKQKIARALVKILKAANVSFGVLGSLERCTGDPARRLGEENLFQTLAKQNIETLQSIHCKAIVANCPHCFNTIRNEYPEFGILGPDGTNPEIVHHSQLIQQLLAEGRLPLGENESTFTFHDPCYLGRYNDEYQAPRSALKAVKGLTILEMEESGSKGLCCGAGGGHFWMDMKIGERVNVLRTEQAAETNASGIATACPFCMQMLEDGIKLTGREEQLEVKDIAEVVAASLVNVSEA